MSYKCLPNSKYEMSFEERFDATIMETELLLDVFAYFRSIFISYKSRYLLCLLFLLISLRSNIDNFNKNYTNQ